MIRFKCRQCGGRMEAPSSMLGKGERCPICGAIQAVRRPFPTGWIIVLFLCLSAMVLALYVAQDSVAKIMEQDRQIEESSRRWADIFKK